MDGKSRYWAFIAYEDSLPNNWKEIITNWYIPVCISPLHNKDKWEDTTEEHKKGDLKKPHYHILLCFGNTTTYNNALTYAKELGYNYIKKISSSRGAYEYWTHKNNPEKAQYNEEDMLYFGGFTREDNITYSEKEIDEIIKGILAIIKNQKIVEYSILIDYLNDNQLNDMLKVARKNTTFFNAYLKSKHYIKNDIKKILTQKS